MIEKYVQYASEAGALSSATSLWDIEGSFLQMYSRLAFNIFDRYPSISSESVRILTIL
jgi:hypothetical protein